MIPLPSSLVVTRSNKAEAKLVDKARQWLESEGRAPGIHASDLLDERLAFFHHTQPTPIQDNQVGLFLVGKILHAFVLGSVTSESGESNAERVDLNRTDSGSTLSSRLGITCSPDYFDGEVAELKTSRSFYEPKDVEKDLGLYIEQLLIYMADKGLTKGKLWVLFLNHKVDGKTSPQFRCYNIEVSSEDLASITSYIIERVKVLESAIRNGSYRELPLCRAWKCSAKQCVYWDDCRPEGRWEKAVQRLAKAAQ